MKKLLSILAIVCVLASVARARGSRFIDHVIAPAGRPAAGATISVCASAGTGTPCPPTASIYSDAAFSTSKANPFTTDGLGNFDFYAARGTYVITVTGTAAAGYSYTITLPCVAGANCAWTGANTFASINNVVYVDGAKYPSTNAGIQQCINAAQAAGADGVCDARGVNGTVPISSSLTDNGSSVEFLAPSATLTQSGPSPVVNFSGRSVFIFQPNTIISCAAAPCAVFTNASVYNHARSERLPVAGGRIIYTGSSSGNPVDVVQIGPPAGTGGDAQTIDGLQVDAKNSAALPPGSREIHVYGCFHCTFRDLNLQHNPTNGFGLFVDSNTGSSLGAQHIIVEQVRSDGKLHIEGLGAVDGGAFVGVTTTKVDTTDFSSYEYMRIGNLVEINATAETSVANAVGPVNISACSRSGNVDTFATSAAHGMTGGLPVYVTGTTLSAGAVPFNGTFSVATVPDATHFTVNQGGDNTAVCTATTGTVTSIPAQKILSRTGTYVAKGDDIEGSSTDAFWIDPDDQSNYQGGVVNADISGIDLGGWTGTNVLAPSTATPPGGIPAWGKFQARGRPATFYGSMVSSNLNSAVYLDGVKYARNSTGINQAVSDLLAASPNGGQVWLTPGSYSITNTIKVSRSNVELGCLGNHASFNASNGSCLLTWNGSIGGTVIEVNSANTLGIGGDGLDGLTVNCNAGSAAVGIKIYSESSGRFKNLSVFDCSRFGIDLGVNSSIPGTGGPTQNNTFENINSFTASVAGMTAWRLTGTATYETSGNSFVDVSGTGGLNGDGFRIENADNDRWFKMDAATSGTGHSIHLTCMSAPSSQNMCAREQTFFGVNAGPGGIKQDGVGAYYATSNDIYGYELCNGAPVPTASDVGSGTMRINLLDCGGANHRNLFFTNSGGNLEEFDSTVSGKGLNLAFCPSGLSCSVLGTDPAGDSVIYDGLNKMARFRAHYGGNGDTIIVAPGTGAVKVGKHLKSAGTILAARNFSLSGGWGRGASVGSIVGTDQAFEVVVTSGSSGTGASPTVKLTFRDGTWTNSPIFSCGMKSGGTGAIQQILAAPTATTLVLTYYGTPGTGARFPISCVGMGR